MNRHIEKAKELRSPQKCYNCAETIMMAYADDLGLTESQAECLGCNFGGGMKCGGTCGAITGGLMVLGALGVLYYKEGRTETAAEHKPDYLRVSQAERERAQKLKKESEGENA